MFFAISATMGDGPMHFGDLLALLFVGSVFLGALWWKSENASGPLQPVFRGLFRVVAVGWALVVVVAINRYLHP